MADPTCPTLNARYEPWRADLRLAGKSPRTVRGYANDARNHWLPIFGDRPPNAVISLELRTHAETLRRHGDPRTVLRQVTAVRSLFAYAVARGLVSDAANPTTHIGKRLVHRKPPSPLAFTQDELGALLAMQRDRPERWATIMLLYASGLRRSELVALRDGDLANGRLFVRGAYTARATSPARGTGGNASSTSASTPRSRSERWRTGRHALAGSSSL